MAMEDYDHVQPYIGCWYADATGSTYEVVAIDEDDRTIEIQYFDGTVEELDFGMWFDTPMEMVEPPEDYSGSLDIEREDYGVDISELGGTPEDWGTPTELLERFD